MNQSIAQYAGPLAEVFTRTGQHGTLVLLIIFVNGWVGLSAVSAQNLTDEWVEEVAAPLVDNRIVDGLSVGYIEGNHWGIVHLGHSNRSKKKADNLTLYEIGSIAKVFTSLLLADAVVRGEIDLYSAVDVANPSDIRLPSRDGQSITWKDLSTHRSGLPRLSDNFRPTDSSNPYRNYDSKKAAAFLNEYELPREPGESREYSNFGVSVLGYLIAQNAGKSYQQLLRERIAKPLRMTDCTVSLSREKRKRLATPHDKPGSATSPWTFADLPGAGGIHATMRDMMRFAKAQLSPPAGELGEAIELAWKQQHDGGDSGRAMGLGWMIWPDGQTHWHNGGTGGFSSALYINRQSKCAVIALCNTSVSGKMDELAIQLITKAAGQEVKPPPLSRRRASKGAHDGKGYAKKSPFTGVRWQPAPNDKELPEVQVGGQWYKLVSLDGHLAQEIIAFSQKTFAGKWKKRFEEDLVELLSRMGHPPKDTVKLVVQSLTSAETQVLDAVRMTTANRQAIKNAPQAGARAKPDPIDAKLRGRLVGRYELNPNFIFTVRDRDGHLMVGITNQPTLEVYSDSPTRWSYRGIEATIEFKLTKSGPAKRLILHQNGAEQTARRMK